MKRILLAACLSLSLVVDFKGRIVVVDFWVIWCGPCKAEDVATYRKDPAHAMPWKHNFVEGGCRSDLAKAYGVFGIPKPVLVEPDDRVVATEGGSAGREPGEDAGPVSGNRHRGEVACPSMQRTGRTHAAGPRMIRVGAPAQS